MELYVAFSNDAILEGAAPQERFPEGQTWAPIPLETQVAPTEEPTKELAPAEVSMEEAAPTEEPTKELVPAEVSMEEVAPTKEPTKELVPAEVSAEEWPPQRSPMRNWPL